MVKISPQRRNAVLEAAFRRGDRADAATPSRSARAQGQHLRQLMDSGQWDRIFAGIHDPKPKKKKGGGGSFFDKLKRGGGDVVGAALEVLDTGRAAVTSTVKEVGDWTEHVSGGKPVINKKTGKEEKFSWSELRDQITDKKKRLSARDLLEARGTSREDTTVFEHVPDKLKGVTGLATDIIVDPLTWVGGAGIAKHGGEKVAEEVAQSGARLMAAETDDAARAALRAEVESAVSRARRYNVSGLSKEEINKFLTREGRASKPLAHHGLEVLGTGKRVPLTDKLTPVSRQLHKGLAKIGDRWYTEGNPLVRQGGLHAAARSKVGSEAYTATMTKLAAKAIPAETKSMKHELGVTFQRMTKGWTDDQVAAIPRAREGSEEALALLGADKAAAAKAFMDDLHARAAEAGININLREGYWPHWLTQQAREGLGITQGTGGGFRRFFEKARTSLGFEQGRTEYEAFGKKIVAHNQDELTQKGQQAFRELAVATGLAKDDMEAMSLSLFEPNTQKTLNAYLDGLSKRIATNHAVQKLSDAGIGATKVTEEVLTKGSKKQRKKLLALIDALDQHRTTLGEQADQLDATAGDIQTHLAGGRLGQLEADLAGSPVDAPLSDAQQLDFAQQAAAGARGDLSRLQEKVARLDELDARSASYRGNAAQTLREDIAALKDELSTAPPGGVPYLERQIDGLLNEASTWATRRDAVIGEALAGDRSGVVMPEGFDIGKDRWQQALATPHGPWTEVQPRVAARNAGAALESHQQVLDAHSLFVRLAPDLDRNDARVWVELMREPLFANLLKGQSRADFVKGIVDNLRGPELVQKLDRAMRGELDRVAAEMKAGAKYAEGAIRRGEDGIVAGPLMHGSGHRWVGDVPQDQMVDAEHVIGNLDGPGLHLTNDQSGRIVIGDPTLEPGPHGLGYALKGENPTVYTMAPRDPGAPLVPLDGVITPEDAPQQLLDAVSTARGDGGRWMFDEPVLDDQARMTAPMIDVMADDDPIAAFLVQDAADWTAANVPGIDPQRLLDRMIRAYGDEGGYHGAYRWLRGELSAATDQGGDQAAAAVTAYTDHLYDDLGIKGFTRQGGTNSEHGIEHLHHIYLRPNEDLELVGTTDFSAAYADKVHREALANADETRGAITSLIDGESSLARKQRDLAKYSKTPGAVRESPKTRRAKAALEAAVDQENATASYLADTAEMIDARKVETLDKLRRAKAVYQSGAPLSAEMRALGDEYMNGLREGIRWGNVHQRALEIGDTQLQRVAALERTAADTRARMADMAQQAVEANQSLASLPTKTITAWSDGMKRGAYKEIKAGVGTPHEVADWLLQTEKFLPPEKLRGYFAKHDRIVGWIKDWQIARPGFHVRNSIGGTFNNLLADMDMSAYLKFARLWKRVARGQLDKVSPQELDWFRQIQHSVGRGQVGAEFAPLGEELGGRTAIKARNFFIPTRQHVAVRASRNVGEEVEFFLRGSLAYDTLAKGGTIDDAVSMVHRYHFNYEDLSAVEQGIKKFVPFYTWTRKNVPLQFEMMVKNPKWYSRYNILKDNVEAGSSPDAIVPDWIQQEGGIRLPIQRGGGHEYLSLDLPMNDINTVAGGPSDMLSMVTPLYKAPIEHMMGKQVYKGIPLSTSKPVPVPLPALLVKGVAPALKAAGLATERGGQLYMNERDAYILEQNVPIVAQYRRLFPQEDKYERKRWSSIFSYFGLGIRSNTKEQQAGAEWGLTQTKAEKRRWEKALDELAGKH